MDEIEIVKWTKKKITLSIAIGFFVLALALAIAIPNLMENRKPSAEIVLKNELTNIYKAQEAYYSKNGHYAGDIITLIDNKFYKCDEIIEKRWRSIAQGRPDDVYLYGWSIETLKWTPTSYYMIGTCLITQGIYLVDKTGKIVSITSGDPLDYVK